MNNINAINKLKAPGKKPGAQTVEKVGRTCENKLL